jgi:putative DNA primase/helicase
MNSVSERNLAIIDGIDSAKIQSWRENPQEAVESLEKKMALSKKTVFKTMCIHELANYKFKPREPILSPWLNSQDLCMVYAARGIGKTHFAISVAYAVATGTDFLKWKADKPRKVLYLDGELPGVVLQQRLAMHCPSIKPKEGYFKAWTPDLMGLEEDSPPMPDLSTVDGQKVINAQIEADTAFIVIDNLSAWCRTGRENEGESWLPMSTWLSYLRRRGIAVLLVHHAGKNGAQRGTSKKEDLLDISIALDRPKEYLPEQGAAFTAEFTKARHLKGNEAESLEIVLNDVEDKAQWSWRTVELSTFDRVVTLANEGLKASEIVIELDIHKSTVSRHLKKAKSDGLLTDASKL